MLESGTFETRLSLAFITDSAFDFGQYQTNTLPSTKQAVNVFILRDQEIILTKNFNTDSSMINMFFPGFTKIMLDNFGQNIVPSKQPFNQGLVLEKGLFKFVNINSTTLYEVKNTKDISQTYQLLSQLINQEQKFLNQLESFMQMLIKSKVFGPTSTQAPVVQPEKRSIMADRRISQPLLTQNPVFPLHLMDPCSNR